MRQLQGFIHKQTVEQFRLEGDLSDVRQELLRDNDGAAFAFRLHRASGVILEYDGMADKFLDFNKEYLADTMPEELKSRPFRVLSNLHPDAMTHSINKSFTMQDTIQFEADNLEDALRIMAKHYAYYSRFSREYNPEDRIAADLHILDFRKNTDKAICVSLKLEGYLPEQEIAFEKLLDDFTDKYRCNNLFLTNIPDKTGDIILTMTAGGREKTVSTTTSHEESKAITDRLVNQELYISLSPEEFSRLKQRLLEKEQAIDTISKTAEPKQNRLNALIETARSRIFGTAHSEEEAIKEPVNR